MPLGLGTALWAYVAPVEKTNLLPNPSYELGDYNTAAVSGGVQVLGTSSAFQQFGAWSLLCVPNSNGTSGASVGTWASTNGVSYTASSYVRGAVGQNYCMCVQDQSTLAIIGSTNFDGGGTFQRYQMSYTETGDTTRKLTIRKTSGAGVGSYWIDGSQVEVGSITTYIDGDQGGGTWQLQPHNSSSVRSGQYRGGGSVIALADIGLQVNDMLGAGVLPIEVSTQSYAVIDGAEFQRQRGAQRKFTLTAKPISGTSLADFHITRRTLYDAFKPDLVTPQQPVRFIYVGAQGTQQLDGYYDSGLELGNMDGPIAESLGVSFIATDPYWYAPTQIGTTLNPRVSIGSANYMAKRSPLGAWGSVGQGAGPNEAVFDMLISPLGTMFVCGTFQTLDGTAGAKFMGMYNPQTNRWGTLRDGTVVESTRALAYNNGTLFFGGAFQGINGTAGGKFLGKWTLVGGLGTLEGGTVDNQVTELTYAPTGTLFVGGIFAQAAGTNANGITTWTGALGTLSGGSVSNAGAGGVIVYSLVWGANQSLYAAGFFEKAGGTTANNFAFHKNGTWGTVPGGLRSPAVSAGTLSLTMTQAPNGNIFVGGNWGSAAAANVSGIAQYNGVTFSQLNGGGPGTAGTAYVYTITADPTTGMLFAAGSGWNGTAGNANTPESAGFWNTSTWLPIDIDIPSTGAIYTSLFTPDHTLYIAGSWAGTSRAAAVGTIVNPGRAQAYPTLRMRNLSASGTARVYQMVNTTTGNGVYFNLSLLAGEMAELDLTPGNRSFQSNIRGNLFNSIVPGSNLATWTLLPGTNYVSTFADNDSLELSLFWPVRGWSVDSGTVY